MTPPRDMDLVQSAIRLGWYVAEVRGRNRPDAPPGATADVPPRLDHPLPLRIERSRDEQRLQAQFALSSLAGKLGVDPTTAGLSATRVIDDHAHRLAHLRADTGADPDDIDRAWGDLTGALWDLDAHIQDQLTAASDTQASGYQLGRGLAECYWALNPKSTQGWDAWTFLFDNGRCAELSRLTARLTGYLQPFAAPAIAGSVQVWKQLAGDVDWRRQPTVVTDLYNQLRTWYELLVLGKDPTAAVGPFKLVRNWRASLTAARIFLPQLLLAALGVAGIFLLLFALSSRHISSLHVTLSGVLAALGLSSAGLSGRVKRQAQAMQTRLRQDIYTDLIAVAITTAPPPPHKKFWTSREATLEKAVRRRTFTPVTPLS